MNKNWDIFISYDSEDADLAKSLYQELKPHARVFLERDIVIPGDDWDKAIADAIASANVIVVLISPTFDSHFQRDEILHAIEISRQPNPSARLIPVFIRGASPNCEYVPFGLRPKQSICMDEDNIIRTAHAILSVIPLNNDPSDSAQRFSSPIRSYMARLDLDIDRLTNEQFRAIEMLRYVPRVRISGSAGSGKTLVAAEKALRMARGGASVLFLCHSPILTEHVKNLTSGEGVMVEDFCGWIERKLGAPYQSSSNKWTVFHEPGETSLQLATDRIGEDEEKFDAIIIDEGQDFKDTWWPPVEASLNRKDGVFYLFHDNEQSLFPHRGNYPIHEPHIDLSKNCRNAGKIFEMMQCYNNVTLNPDPKLKNVGTVKLKQYNRGEEKAKLIEALNDVYKDGLIQQSVIIWIGYEPMPDCPISNCYVEVTGEERWQDFIQSRISDLIEQAGSNFSPVTLLKGDVVDIVPQAFSEFSHSAIPQQSDIEIVREISKYFSIDYGEDSTPSFFTYDNWLEKGGEEYKKISNLESGNWSRGFSSCETFHITPFFEPQTASSIPLYGVADFKGLEANNVILLMRGKIMNASQAVYVGVSRAKYGLYILGDKYASELLPQSFIYDAADGLANTAWCGKRRGRV